MFVIPILRRLRGDCHEIHIAFKLGMHSEFKSNLGYLRPCLRQTDKTSKRAGEEERNINTKE